MDAFCSTRMGILEHGRAISRTMRFAELIGDEGEINLMGVPFDDSVIGRKGAKGGPAAIRAAFRFLGSDLMPGAYTRKIRDFGDVPCSGTVLEVHATVEQSVAPLMDKPTILLGGDHGLTYPHICALASKVQGTIGIIVIDAHYDLRPWQGQPSSGTPFRRILEEMDGRIKGEHLTEIGIRPFANAAELADVASAHGITIVTPEDVRTKGAAVITAAALAMDVDHVWLSIDIDGLDQSIASGCSSPGAGGLQFHEAETITRLVASDPRCRGMDLLEVAPNLDETGNTARTAAQLVATFAAHVHLTTHS
jgi:formiminoglutamase